MTASTEIAVQNSKSVFSNDILASIQTFEDVKALFSDNAIALESMDDYGTGFKVTEKSSLVGVPLVILEWRFNNGDFGDDGFVSATAVTKHGEKVIFNDGSTGILSQLRMVTGQRIQRGHATPQAGLLVEGGLTRSDYVTQIPDAKGVMRDTPATTFYLAE